MAEKSLLLRLQELVTKSAEKHNALKTLIDNYNGIGLSQDTGQVLLIGQDGGILYTGMTATEIATKYEGINGVERFTTALKTTVESLSSGLTSKADLDPDTGKLVLSQVPQFAITNKIAAAEPTLTDFITNVNSYTFDEGDVIVIDNAGTLEHYLYDGNDRALETSYSPVNTTQIGWANITGKPTNLVESVSGTGVDNTDPKNPVISQKDTTQIESDIADHETRIATLEGKPAKPTVENTDNPYLDVAALIADQNNQMQGDEYLVTDASGFTDPDITTGEAIVLLTKEPGVDATGTEADYIVTWAKEFELGGSGTPEVHTVVVDTIWNTGDSTTFTVPDSTKVTNVQIDGADYREVEEWERFSPTEIKILIPLSDGDWIKIESSATAVAVTPKEEEVTGTATENATATGTVNLDLATFSDTYLTLTGNTIITVSNTPGVDEAFVKTATIKSSTTESLTLPVGWTVVGAYVADGSENYFSIKFSNHTTAGLKVICIITQA